MSEKELSAGDLELPIKRTTGETLEERLTGNAYHNILPARYLRKDANGDLVEQQEGLFERVARNIALAEAVFEADNRGVEVTVTPAQLKPDHPRRDELAEEVFGKGATAGDWEADDEEAAGDASGETASDAETALTQYNVNKFAYETVVPELPDEVREHVEATAEEFQEAMERLSFMPNCVPPDSLVATGGGMKEISDVEPGERVYDDRDGHAEVETKYQNGTKPVVEIETDSGYSVRATPEHYFRVINGDGEYEWRQVKDLEPGHSLALQKNFLDDEGERTEFDPVRRTTDGGVATQSTNGRPRSEIETPDSLSPEFAEWIGLYVGDGTARESGVRVAFDDADEDLVEHWRELTDAVFGFEPTTRQRADTACVVGQAFRRDLYAFLDQNNLLKESSENASVPAPVLESGRSPVASFLRGLFEADGTVGERQIELYTHSETLGRQVQKLLLGLGIRSQLSEKRDGYRVSIRKNVCGKRFVERVGFISDRKSQNADRFRNVSENATSITVPNQSERLLEWYRDSDLGLDAYRDLSQFLIDPDSEYQQEIGKSIFERYAEEYPELRESPVAEHVERDQIYESVSSITGLGTMSVEDMQVPRRDTYVVEGFVSHNSPTLMNAGDELQQLSACFVDSPEDDIDDIHQTAKEAAQVFQCLTEGARVYVEGEGVVSVADVEPGDRIAQRDGESHRTQTVAETHAYNDAPVARVETAAGIEVTGTPNHELLVDGEWTRIDETEPGDALSLRLDWIENEKVTSGLTTVAGGAQWSENRTVSNEAILELYSEGLSDYEIADRLDSSASTIQRRRSLELGLDPNGTGGRPGGNVSFDETEFERLHDDGLSDGEIAGELGVSTRSVARYREGQSLDANGQAVKTVRQPTEFTPDLAELVGMWVGDGSKHEDGIRFHLNREETLERADRLCRDLFDVGLDWRWEDGCYDAGLHSHEIKRWWLANFGDAKPDATSASAPEQVWQADRETVGAFLRGLFSTDGSLQKDLYPRLWSSSGDLIEDVQQLLLGVGIPATQWEYDVDHREYYNVGPTAECGLDRFLETVGFVDSRSETMAETFESVDSDGPSVGTIDGSTWDVPVEAVEDAGTATVYDVTVDDDPEYVASSVVSHNSGGGMGYAFWRLRPYGDPVGSTGGIASGPITFMRTYDQMCETIAQGGARRGAQMGVMRVSHPDVVQFIHAKNKDVSLAHTLRLNDPDDYTHTTFAEALEEARELIDDEGRVPKHLRNAVEGHLSNFNISVGVTDRFMEAVQNDEEYTFTNPRTGDPHVATPQTKELYDMFDLGEYVEVGETLSVPATELWERILEGAHENGEPGVIYLERVNKEHSFDVEEHPDHRILATNPCLTGEMEVTLADGTTRPIDGLADSDERTEVRTLEEGDVVTRPASAFKTKTDADVVRITTESGLSLRVTPDHEIRNDAGNWIEAQSLSPGDEVVGLSKVRATPHGSIQETTTETVASVEPDGSDDVYDLTVEGTHNFFASASGEESVNVHNCGEQPLEEYEACNLGHINLSTLAAEDAPDWRVWSAEHGDEYDTREAAVAAFLEESIDWEEFDRRIELGTRFLENVVTMSDFPVEEIEDTVREMRKIGLGIMGLAQLYIQLGMKYGSDTSNEVARQLMRHINHHSKWTSHELAGERGTFGEWDRSKYADPTEYREWFEKQTGLDAGEWDDGFPMRNHNTTTIAPTGCVEESSLVSTDEGLRPIKDLDETTAEFEQWREIEVGVSTDGGTKTATAVYDNGFADVRRIETEGGFSVAATPNHRFRTITDDGEYAWKEADEFESGDRIVLQRGAFDGESRVALDASERTNYYRNTDDDLKLPDRMEPELAEFLGYFMGDGYVHDEVGVKLVVESDVEELDEYLRDLGESVFGVTPTVEDRDTRHVLTFGGRHLSRYFADNDWKKDAGNAGEGAASAFVPQEVLQGDEAVGKAFLRGLFEADGTASRKVELSTVSPTLAEQVQTLLLSLDCVFVRDVLEMDQRDDHYGDRPRHTLRGANKREDLRFLDEVGFITKSTDLELTAQSYKNDTYPPAVVDALRDVDGYEDVSAAVKKRVNQSPINGSVSRKLVRDVEEETGDVVRLDGRRLTDFYAASVESVTEETAYTKDISVPSNNTYVANGFVTHNTTSMVGNTTGGCEPIYNVAYYKNVSDDVQGDEMLVEFDDYFLRVLEENDLDVEAVKREAQEQMAENEFDGVDGLTTVPNAVGELFVTTGDLSAKQHAGIQVACQEGVDSAISKCLEEGTLVQTDSGVRPIESFVEKTPEPGEFVDVEEDVTIDGVPVESQYYAGEKDATRVRVDNGTEVVGATESHKVLTPDGWTVLGELEEGDYVVGRHVESHGDGGTEIAFDRGRKPAADGGVEVATGDNIHTIHEKDVDIPSKMSPRLARFLGMYAADGSAIDGRYSIEISTSSERVRDEVCDLFEALFGREPNVETDTRGGDERDTVYGVALNSRPVWEFVTELCGSGAYEKKVPREVLQGSPQEKLAFVNGATLDGYVAAQSLVVYGGMSHDLADGVAELLRSFGVPKVYVGRKWIGESDAYSYQVHVTNDAQDLVTPVEPHKRVERFEQRYRVHVPRDRVDKTEYYSRSTEYYAARNFEYRDRNYMFDTTAEKLGITDAPPLYEVTETEDVGTREMYDIELAGPHEYVVGGVVSHNTVNAPNDSTVEDAKEVFEYIYEGGGKGVTYYRDGTRSKQVLTTRAENTDFADMGTEEVVEQIEEVFGGLDEFLEDEAVQAALDEQVEELLATADEGGVYAEKKPRPDQLHGVTQRIDTGYGKLYVTINEDPQTGEPFELFANTGHSGGFTNSFTDALAKTISVALRSGVDPYEIVDKLQGIRSPKVAWDKGEQINSIPDAFGTALRRYLDDEVDKAYPQQQTLEETAEDADDGRGTETPAPETDGGPGATADAGTDAETVDAGPDAGVVDAGPPDAGTTDTQQAIIDSGESPECPECGAMSVYYSEGCKTCESCGWSEC